MTDLPKKFAELLGLMKDLERDIEYGISGAQSLPERYAAEVDRLSFNSSYNPPAEVLKASAALKNHVRLEERHRGVLERDQRLRDYAAKLESLRAILPGLAVDVSIELGVIARDIDPRKKPR